MVGGKPRTRDGLQPAHGRGLGSVDKGGIGATREAVAVAREALLTATQPEVLGARMAPLPSENQRIAGGSLLIPGLHDARATGTNVTTTMNASLSMKSSRKTTTTIVLPQTLHQ